MSALFLFDAEKKYDPKAVPLSSFLSGSWDAYLLVNHDPSVTFTSGDIAEAMEVFDRNHKVNVYIKAHPELVLWELHLEERRVRRGTRRSGEGRDHGIIRKFRFAVNTEHELLFANRAIPAEIKKGLCRGLDCDNLKPISLNNSDPVNLLMLYKQANVRSPGVLKLQYQETLCSKMEEILSGFSLSNETEEIDHQEKEIQMKLGYKLDEMPCLRKLTAEVEDVPLTTKNPGLKGFKLKNVNVELSGGSVYHMYAHLGEAGVINTIPRWVIDTREKGKTHSKAKFS